MSRGNEKAGREHADRSPGFARNPDYRIGFVSTAKRIRAKVGGETVVDSTRARILLETGHLPVYYFPAADVRPDLLETSNHTSHCPYKGAASYRSIRAGDRYLKDAVWIYETPYREMAEIGGFLALYWDRMDHWYEEDEEVFGHPRDPFHRLDVRPSLRRVRVELAGETVAETSRAMFLFETGLPPRYYIPPEDVRLDLLEPSDTATVCPYKGTASYWSVRIGRHVFKDVVWSYPIPLPEMPRIRNLMAFLHERTDALTIDGETVPKPGAG